MSSKEDGFCPSFETQLILDMLRRGAESSLLRGRPIFVGLILDKSAVGYDGKQKDNTIIGTLRSSETISNFFRSQTIQVKEPPRPDEVSRKEARCRLLACEHVTAPGRWS